MDVARVDDARGRPLRDLRISVTDRCNLRCTYCMPKEVFGARFRFLARDELLSFEEIARVATIFVELGVRKIRLTGGEPLLRRNLDRLVTMLAPLDVDLALTTNGALLARHAFALKRAGLKRVTVSLDSLDDRTLAAVADADVSVAAILEGIDAAERAGLEPIKINVVVRRGVNDDGIIELARHFKGTGHVVRFIEYMDVGTTNGWRRDDVVSGAEIVARIDAAMPLEPVDSGYRGEVARRWRYRDGSGEIGIITSISSPFCGDCTRARLSADGKIFTCLFATNGFDLREPLRAGASNEELRASMAAAWSRRSDRYSELRAAMEPGKAKVEMSYIGG